MLVGIPWHVNVRSFVRSFVSFHLFNEYTDFHLSSLESLFVQRKQKNLLPDVSFYFNLCFYTMAVPVAMPLVWLIVCRLLNIYHVQNEKKKKEKVSCTRISISPDMMIDIQPNWISIHVSPSMRIHV